MWLIADAPHAAPRDGDANATNQGNANHADKLLGTAYTDKHRAEDMD
jgi:hypothetical protein